MIYAMFAYSSTELFTIGVIDESGGEAVANDVGSLTVHVNPCIIHDSNNINNLISVYIIVVVVSFRRENRMCRLTFSTSSCA